MNTRRKTGFDKFFDEQMKAPAFSAGYSDARAEIDAVDRIVRVLDEARVETGLTKAELARLISAKPEIVRRLFTSASPNPTLATVAKLASALGYKLELVPASGPRRRATEGSRARGRRRAVA